LATAATTSTYAPGPLLRARRWASGFTKRDTWAAYAFLSPWLFGFIVLTAGPMVASLILSFTDYSIISETHSVGLQNYHDAIHDPKVRGALRNTAIYTLFHVPGVMIVSLILAMLLARVGERSGGIFRTIFYLPVMTPKVAVGVLFLLLFNGTSGIINRALDTVGIPGPFWTTDPHWVKPGLVIMSFWAVGTNVIIYLAAIKSVPRHLYEAAAMDGASPWRRFRDITLPMISPALFFTLIVLTINSIQTFDEVYTAFFNQGVAGGSSGGPDAARFVVIYLFQQAFGFFHLGYASAIAWILFGIIAIVTAVQIVASRRFVYYEGARK
jgi:multiple sugar transport system permease protein